MRTARFGIAAALALSVAPAWAGEEKSDEQAKSDRRSRSDRAAAMAVNTSSTGGSVEARSSSATPTESKDVRASFEERWLVEREGYRDGGY